MLIISEIEKKFDIKFKLKELNKINNLGNLLQLIESKIVENNISMLFNSQIF